MYIHVWVIEFTSLSTILLFEFGTVPEVPYFCFFILFLICHLILVFLHAHVFMNALKVSMTVFSHFRDRPVPIFSDVVFSYLALVQDKNIKCVLQANTCCTVYVNCSPPPNYSSFSFLK